MKKCIFIISIIIFFLICCISGCIENIEDRKDKYGWSEKEVKLLAEEIMNEKFISPSTTYFYNITVKLTKENFNNNEYKISGIVDSENKFGKKITSIFYIYLECSSEGEYQIGDWDIYV